MPSIGSAESLSAGLPGTTLKAALAAAGSAQAAAADRGGARALIPPLERPRLTNPWLPPGAPGPPHAARGPEGEEGHAPRHDRERRGHLGRLARDEVAPCA